MTMNWRRISGDVRGPGRCRLGVLCMTLLVGCAVDRSFHDEPPLRRNPQPALADVAWENGGSSSDAPASAPPKPEPTVAPLQRADSVIEHKIARKRSSAGEKVARNPGDRYRDWYRDRAGDDGVFTFQEVLEAKALLQQVPRLEVPAGGAARDAGIFSWEWLGPGNIGGRIRAIAIHPANPDTMWIGSVSGGIWRTDNGGISWSPVNDFLPTLAVSSIVIDPTDPDTLYAGTGEGFSNADALPGAGVFKSTDGGMTWVQLPSTAAWSEVNRLAIDPTNGQNLLAATNDGIYRTDDGGLSWAHPTTDRTMDVQFDPSDGSKAVAGLRNGAARRTTNGGQSWTLVTIASGAGRVEVAYAPSNPMIVYVSVDNNQGELYQSADGGLTFSLQNGSTAYLQGQGWYDNTVWVAPDNPDLVVVGGIDLWRSTNGGVNLTKISRWQDYHDSTPGFSAHADQHIIVAHPNYGGGLPTNRTVFVGNDGGIQWAANIITVSENFGWTNLANNLGITQFYGGAASPDGQFIIGGSQDNDTLRYRDTDGTQAWFQAETGDGGACAIDYDVPFSPIFYSEYVYLDMEKSTDGGQTYLSAKSGLTDAGDQNQARFIAPFSMDPNDSDILVAGGTSIWRTINGAATWTSIRAPLPAGTPPRCSAIDIAVGDSDRIWVGYDNRPGSPTTQRGRVSRTTDGGASWDDVDDNGPNPLPNRTVTDIAINPANHDEVFVTFAGYLTDSVWLTTDDGLTWQQRTGSPPHDLPALQVNTVRFHPLYPDWVYIGTDLGVLASEDKGLTWSQTPLRPGTDNEGPVNTEVAELFWQGDEFLIAATHGRGMFRTRPLIPFGACCDPGGGCTQEFDLDCAAIGGEFKGAGTTCLGDTDGNGVDQICEPLPPAGHDRFASKAVFRFKLTSPAGGTITTVTVEDADSVVLRSDPQVDAGPGASDTSGDLGNGTSGCVTDPRPGTSDDADIIFHPPGYENAAVEEIHTEMCSMRLEGKGWVVRAGDDAAPEQSRRSYGEVESRSPSGTGFPADSFFNLYLAIEVPPSVPTVGGRTLCNHAPVVVESKGITALPPGGAAYLHTMEVTGRVALYDCWDDCFVGWLDQGSHSLGGVVLGPRPIDFPVVFSVDRLGTRAEGLSVPPAPNCLGIFGHPEPNDVYALGLTPGGHGYETWAELFESAGDGRPRGPDATNVARISAALALGPAPGGGPPYLGPFSPNTGAPSPAPPPPGSPVGVLGLVPGDNINALSFGEDGGDVLIFSVGTNAIGAPVSAVEHQAQNTLTAPPSSPVAPFDAGGAPGREASADLFLSSRFVPFGQGTHLVGLTAAPPGSNYLLYDEWDLGLQAPASVGSAFAPPDPEDNLDALEADTADAVDADGDGIPDGGKHVYFSLDPSSPTVSGGGAGADDILVATAPGFAFTVYADGVADIGLLPGDDLDALVLFDTVRRGVLDAGADEALFSLAAGSPSLIPGNNPNMPPGPLLEGDVFYTGFSGVIGRYASAEALGLYVNIGSNASDELDALDIGWSSRCDCADCGPDCDGDGINDLCDNCPSVPNPDQADTHGNGVGNACVPAGDADHDGDGFAGGDDLAVLVNCLSGPNAGGMMLSDCFNFDFDFDFDVDLGDYAGFQGRFGLCVVPVGPCNDCNGNGVADMCDISAGTSNDCGGNGMPDECDPDCNANGAADDCDIENGISPDCNNNGIPDECDVAARDCNLNGTPDDCDIAGGDSADCDGNGVPDECDPDCNVNGVPDGCEIVAGTSADCNGNGTPDECDVALSDCNGNGAPDDCDIAGGTSLDFNGNGIPDECEPPWFACCESDGTCALLSEADCAAVGGRPAEPGAECAGDGNGDLIDDFCALTLWPCCMADQTCLELPLVECLAIGGAPQSGSPFCPDIICPGADDR